MSQYRIREREGLKRVYANPDDGWVGGVKPKPTDPEDAAKLFDTVEEAEAFIKQHDMDADPEKVGR